MPFFVPSAGAAVSPFARRAGAALVLAISSGTIGSLCASAPAFACGAATGGAAGISGCSLSEHDEESRLKWRIGAGYSFTSTGLHFGGLRVDEVRESSDVALDWRPIPRLTLEVGAGPFLGGHITTQGIRFDMSPGLASAIGASYRVLDADGAIPFVLLTSQISYVSSATEGIGYNAFDLRLGVAVGTTLWHVFTPYLVGRAFGGPVYWRFQGTPLVGTDDHHWQVGAGFSLSLGSRFDLYAEGVPLGEQGATAGLGYSF
jgi:hypothetical protein